MVCLCKVNETFFFYHNLSLKHLEGHSLLLRAIFRTALGAFYNHSEEPNCVNTRGFWHQIPVCYLQTIKPIIAGEELTAKYTLYGDFDMESM